MVTRASIFDIALLRPRPVGAITEDHGMLAPSEQLAYAFEPGQLYGLDW